MSSKEVMYLGIDEAGRGSVIGPLVMGAVIIDQKTLDTYSSSEITDSKQLSPVKRVELFNTIIESCYAYSAILLNPVTIDKALLSETSNLNLLELETMKDLIIKHKEATNIYIDAISKPDYCTNNLKLLLKDEPSFLNIKKKELDTLEITRSIEDKKTHITLVAQNKADLNFKVVSAASIIAKVTRDRKIRELETEFNLEKDILASGYPNDQLNPFLKKYKKQIKNREFPFIRYSWEWAPLKKILSNELLRQSKLFL